MDEGVPVACNVDSPLFRHVSVCGCISRIQRFSVHDGPGIRTTVFLKGCPLSCKWCHNPETISFGSELSCSLEKCVRCRQCAVCTHSALDFSESGLMHISQRCVKCFQCSDICPSGALSVQGRDISAEDLLPELLEDMDFYRKGGGVTLSGGEPTAQAEFCLELLELLGKSHVHTALDTSGHCNSATFAKLCSQADLILFDIKHMSTQQHEILCGVGNELILANLSMLIEMNKPIEIRIPLISKINDDEENIMSVASFLAGAKNVTGIKLLGYHKLGLNKSTNTTQYDFMKEATHPSDERLTEIIGVFKDKLPETPIFRA